MSIFLSGNNVASQPYIAKKIDSNKPPTNLSLPFDVDFLLPENGGAATGSVTVVKGGTLVVVLAGENDLTNQVSYTMVDGETLSIQARYISSTSDVDQITVSVALSSTSTISMPYYNFSAKADWYQVFGGNNPSLSEFNTWLDNQGHAGTYTANGWTYVESTVYSEWGHPIGEISCDLVLNNNKEFYFNDYFYEINGVGELQLVESLKFENNEYLTYINSYYPIYCGKSIRFTDNYTLSIIGGEIINNRYTNILVQNCYNFKEFQNFTQFSDDMDTIDFRNNCNQGYPHDYLSTPIEFNYQMNNCVNLGTVSIVNNYITGIDWSIIESCDNLAYLYINNNMLNTFNPEYLPDSISFIDLSLNSLFEFKPKILPTSLTGLILSYNQLPEFNLEFDFPGQCYNLSQLSVDHNKISKWNQGLPYSVSNLDLSYNEITVLDGSCFTPSLNNLSLSHNPLREFPKNISHLTYLYGLNLNYTIMEDCNVDLTGCNNITQLEISYCQIKNLNLINANAVTNVNANYNTNIRNFTLQKVHTLISSLNFSDCGFETFSTDLKTLTPNVYYINTNNWFNISSWTASFPNGLSSFSLYYTPLKTFSPKGGLNNIYNLSLYYNQLESFDVDITTSTNLNTLYLQYNNIATWNKSINGANMQTLDLSHNKLTSITIPGVIPTYMAAYGQLNLQYNYLSSVNLNGNKFPAYFYLDNNLMTTASWNAMNTYATGLPASVSATLIAYTNTNTITGTTLNTTLTAKGVVIYP